MPTMCSREIFTKKCRQQQIFKVGWYPLKKNGSSHLNVSAFVMCVVFFHVIMYVVARYM